MALYISTRGLCSPMGLRLVSPGRFSQAWHASVFQVMVSTSKTNPGMTGGNRQLCISPRHEDEPPKLALSKHDTRTRAGGESQRFSPDLPKPPDYTKRVISGFDVHLASDNVCKSDVTVVTTSKVPLVILIPWLNAQDRHVEKFCKLYLENNIDVLHVRVTLTDVIQPLRTRSAADELLNLLEKDDFFNSRPLVIHGFSVGAFFFGQFLLRMAAKASTADRKAPTLGHLDEVVASGAKAADLQAEGGHRDNDDVTGAIKVKAADVTVRQDNDVRRRIMGVVLDSPAPVETIATGLSNAFSDRAAVRGAVRCLATAYLKLLPRSVANLYAESAAALEENELRLPHLVLYSAADVVVPAWRLEARLEEWRARGRPGTGRGGFEVRARKWHDSPHVRHFQAHPDQYREAVTHFLRDVAGLPVPPLSSKL